MFYLGILSIQRKIRRNRLTETRWSTNPSVLATYAIGDSLETIDGKAFLVSSVQIFHLA